MPPNQHRHLPALLLLLIALGAGEVLTSCAEAEPQNVTTLHDLVSLEGIEDGQALTGTITVKADLSLLDSVRGVEFYVDDVKVDTAILEPYEGRINTKDFPDGTHALRVIAAISGTEAADGEVIVRFDNNGPSVTMLAPSDGATIYHDNNPIEFSFAADDPSGVIDLACVVNGIPVPVTPGPPFTVSVALEDLMMSADNLPLSLVVSVSATDGLTIPAGHSFTVTVASRINWTFTGSPNPLDGAPAVGPDGSIYVGSTGNKLYAVTPQGEQRWVYDAGAAILNTPVVSKDGALVYASANQLHAVQTANGQRLWAHTFTKGDGSATVIGSSVGLGTSMIYAGTYGDEMVALTPATPTEEWGAAANAQVRSQPAEDPYGLVVFGASDHNVYGVDSTGAQQWVGLTGGEITGSPLITSEGNIVIGSADYYVHCFSRTGEKLWDWALSGPVLGDIAEGPNGVLYAVSAINSNLYALTLDGDELWHTDVPAMNSMGPPAVASDGTVFLGDNMGMVHAISSQGDILWSMQVAQQAIPRPPVLSKDESMLYVSSADRYLYALHTGIVACPDPETVAAGNMRIMRYEASRIDATPTSAGSRTDAVCSRPNARPWVGITWQEARSACVLAGMDLCFSANWETGCAGFGETDYPYGAEYQAAACNGADHPVGGCSAGLCSPMATGANAACSSHAGALDMSGNVREWTLNDNGIGQYLVRGGGFRDSAGALTCSSVSPDSHILDGAIRAEDVGFRCCGPL